jgi:hypothetical protein
MAVTFVKGAIPFAVTQPTSNFILPCPFKPVAVTIAFRRPTLRLTSLVG